MSMEEKEEGRKEAAAAPCLAGPNGEAQNDFPFPFLFQNLFKNYLR
jgi:hypothetical protein